MTPRRKLTSQLDSLLSLQIRKRDGGRCQVCGAYVGGAGETHHIFGKGAYPFLRWEPANLLLLCQRCHAEWHSFREINLAKWKGRWMHRWGEVQCLIEAGEPIGLAEMQEMADKLEGQA
jgi:hypothetical protein